MSNTKNAGEIAWPVKQREMHNHLIDSTRWNDFPFRDDDVVIATWAKTGTTWTQQIVCQLIFDGAEDIPVADIAPWVDMRVLPFDEIMAALEAQTHRRVLKTHLPFDALNFSAGAKYIYIGRDGRDVAWSVYHHHASMTPVFLDLINETPGRVGPPLGPPKDDIVEYFHDWLDGDGFPFWPFWSHVRSWWDAKDLPNVMLLHFNDLKADMEGNMRDIARFLDIEINEHSWPAIVEHCTFDYMKAHAPKLSQIFDEKLFQGGLSNFINKGTNGRWRDRLSADDIARYERAARENLSPDCARWLTEGAAGLHSAPS